MNRVQNPRIVRFGSFEADLHTRELRKHGLKLKLQGQPFQVLAMLLARSGDLVTREEIRSRLWPQDTFIDFDNGLNAAVRRLREALNDNAETPRFVETLPRRGYRFIAPVEKVSVEETVQSETGLVTNPSLAINGRTETGASPSEKAASSVENQVPDADSRGESVSAKPGAAVVEPEVFSTATSEPGASIPQQLVLQRAVEAHAPKRFKVLLAAILTLAVVAVAFVAYQIARTQPKQPAIRSLAVLPLQNLSGDPAQQYLADGITEELIGRLSAIRNLRVISRTSVMRFKNTQLSVPEIARILGVDAVVEGSVMREGSRIRVHAQLIRAASDEHFWSESYDRELRDVLAMDADVAQSVARKVEVTITGEEHERLAAVHPVSPEVYENYLKGKFASDRGNKKSDLEESITYFSQAIRKDPTFAPAYLGLASAYWDLGSVFMGGVAEQERPRAVLAAQKALELDPDLAEAHVLMALIAETQWHWAEAESEYHRALDLRPNDATAYSGLAWWLDCQGRTEEAVTMRRHARELDPLAVSGADLGWDLLFARRYGQAIQELHGVTAVKPEDAFARWILGFVLIANHDPQGAIPELEKGISLSNRSSGVVGLLVNAYAQAGRRRDALRLLDELRRRRQTEYVPAAAFVFAYLGLGNYDQAFVWLEQAYKEQSYALQTLKVLPLFDPIRSDPRFIDLLHRVGLDRPS
jgi:TolB-like protein/DNA-binding winged helix-turn-helix (wHTH) protein/tetratricopeptide (TPR) repeat protein